MNEAVPHLAFINLEFAKDLIRKFNGTKRARIVDAFAGQARHFGMGVFNGDPESHLEQQHKTFTGQVNALPDDPDLDDLAKALRKYS